MSVYVNPFTGAASVTAERVDQGQDFALRPGDPIRAIGRAKILEIQSNWYEGQPAIFYELLEGPRKGQILYVGEQITPHVRAGQIVPAGAQIATYAGSGTGIEYGLGGGGGRTLQQATAGAYSGSGTTPAGEAFSSFLSSLGVNTKGTSSGSGSKPLHEVIPGECSVPVIGGAICAAGRFAQGLGEKTGEAAQSAEQQVGAEAIKGAIDVVKPIGTKLALYGVFILGAVALMVFGVQELLKPIGGPDLAHGLGKAGRTAAEAAAA